MNEIKILKIKKINMLLGMFLHVYMTGEVKMTSH